MRSSALTFLLIGITLASAGLAHTQVNIEKDRMRRRQSGVSGNVSLAMKLQRGNSELTEVDFDPRFVWKEGKHQMFSINNLSFVESDQGSIVNDGFSHLRYNYQLNGWLVAEAFLQGQYDRSQDLTQRYLIGGGWRFLTVRRTDIQLAIGLSAMHEHERLVSGQTSDLIRNSDYVSFGFQPKDRFSLTATTYFQPSTKDIGDLRVLTEVACTTSISKVVGMTSAVNYHYDSRPPAGVREYDLEFTSGFTLSF